MRTLPFTSRKSDEYVEYAYHQIMMQLEEQHAEIRFSAFQLVNELFCRSHAFRTLLLADFQTYIELTMGKGPARSPLQYVQNLCESSPTHELMRKDWYPSCHKLTSN